MRGTPNNVRKKGSSKLVRPSRAEWEKIEGDVSNGNFPSENERRRIRNVFYNCRRYPTMKGAGKQLKNLSPDGKKELERILRENGFELDFPQDKLRRDP